MIWRSAPALALVLALGTCGQGQSVPSGPQMEVIRGQATVEGVEVLTDPSDPRKAEVIARGYLADACTRIDSVQVSPGRGDLIVSVTITTVRPAELTCIQVTKPFAQRIAVDLPAGHQGPRFVEVNGVTHPVRLSPDSGAGSGLGPRKPKKP